MINWYNEVSRNLDKIPDCVAYFEAELLEAKKQCKIYGNLEKASASFFDRAPILINLDIESTL